MRLVLFDIDGTLLRTDGVGTGAIVDALSEVLGREIDAADYVTSGKTDTQICLELMRPLGFEDGEVVASLDQVRAVYLPLLSETLDRSRPLVLPGVVPLLDRLKAREDVCLGLLTGNIERGARAKLETVGLADYFITGAYGDVAAERSQLPQLAVDAARRLTGHTYVGKDIVILGDTPNDVRCGRVLNVTAIGGATGSYTRQDLARHEPDFLFDDLTDADAVCVAIQGEA